MGKIRTQYLSYLRDPRAEGMRTSLGLTSSVRVSGGFPASSGFAPTVLKYRRRCVPQSCVRPARQHRQISPSGVGLPNRLLIFLLLAILCLNACTLLAAAEGEVSFGPYLQNVTSSTAYVCWYRAPPRAALVELAEEGEFKKKGSFSRRVAFEGKSAVAKVHIDGLKSSTRYVYRVNFKSDQGQSVIWGPFRFQTAPKKGEPSFSNFSFIVYGDTRTLQHRHRVVARAIADESEAAFVLHTGDLVTAGDKWSEWPKFFAGAGLFASSKCLYPCLGNHERNGQYYYQLLHPPKGGGDHNKRWYSFDYGIVHFIIIDSTLARSRSSKTAPLRAAQLKWLKGDLRRAAGSAWKILIMHHPIYSSDFRYLRGYRDWELEKRIGEVLSKGRVDLVIAGHCHAYERLEKDGIVYLVTGGGGAPFGLLLRPPSPWTKKLCSRVLHYVKMSVSSDKIHIKVIGVKEEDRDGKIKRLRRILDEVTVGRL
jgi:predicted phosphodiesterase